MSYTGPYEATTGAWGTCGYCGEPIESADELFECAAPGCGCAGGSHRGWVCVGCVRECGDCGRDHCPEHVATEEMDSERFAKHHCAACESAAKAA